MDRAAFVAAQETQPRRMWYLGPNGVIEAPETTKSHIEWFYESEGIDLSNTVRGYVLTGELYIWQGTGFDIPNTDTDTINAIMDHFKTNKANLGVKPAAIGRIWEPRSVYNR
jgi:hypothetical protein